MGRESGLQIHASSFSLSCVQLLCLLFFDLVLSVASLLLRPIAALAPNLPQSLLRAEDDLRKLRQLLGWQSPGFDRWMWRGTFPLIILQPGEFVFFSCYAATLLLAPTCSRRGFLLFVNKLVVTSVE
jgi:hypothetical protein